MSALTLRDLAWKSQPRWRAWAVLAVISISGIAMLAWLQHAVDLRLQDQAAAAKAVVRPVATMAKAPIDPLAGLDKDGLKRLEDEVRLLNRDWPTLLSSIVPKARQTRLLSLDINPASGGVLLVGQAADAAAVSAYVLELDHSGLLQDVRLVSVEGVEQGASKFEVNAQWR